MSHTDVRRQVVFQWMFHASVLAKHLEQVISRKRTLPLAVPHGARIQMERFFDLALQGEKSKDPLHRACFALAQQLLLPATDVVTKLTLCLNITKRLVGDWALPPSAVMYIGVLKAFLSALHQCGQQEANVKITFAADRTTS